MDNNEPELRIDEVVIVLNTVMAGMHLSHHVASAALGQLYRGAYSHFLAEHTARGDLLAPMYKIVCDKFDETNLACVDEVHKMTTTALSKDAIVIDQPDSDYLN